MQENTYVYMDIQIHTYTCIKIWVCVKKVKNEWQNYKSMMENPVLKFKGKGDSCDCLHQGNP
jgi:hypothetical protein